MSLNGSAYMDLPVALRLPQGICERLLVQAGRVQSDRDRGRQQARRGRRQPAKVQRQGRPRTRRRLLPPLRPQRPQRPAQPAPASISTSPAATGRRRLPPHLRPCPPRRSRPRPPMAAAPPPAAPPASASAAPPPQGQSTVIKKAPKPAGRPTPAIMAALSGLAFEPRLSACAADQRQQHFELGSMLARRERETKRREQSLALGPGRLLDGRRPCRPGRLVPGLGRQQPDAVRDRARGSRSPARSVLRPRATNALPRRARRDCRVPPPRTLPRRQRPWPQAAPPRR